DYLIKTYGVHPPELLVEATEKLGRRIGGSALKEVTGYIQNGKLQDACSILLNYYDKKYKYAMLQRTSKVLIDLPLDEIDANIAARQILTRVQHED
ncbi:MAG: hypothetical protein ACE5FF_12940, partial [Saprospiraceae bacterium]